ncbi:MAG: hypothetical protein O9295_16715 [Microcystis sp. LE18-22.4A]|jgi:hypothetical protein|uniref:DUF6876 family protein n=1 Tax=Microcystis sp. LE18-22.4A TaxID=3016432 RepID=UPI0022CC755A|nr:DUF6876 family protein [Microcystis sp. LE18-22.4A]MCZ8119641.1 hypothetical protein [Microcystis sp. LE18-22.4A]
MNKLENLSQFTGTENHYRNKNYPFLYTDGIKYLAENGGAYWLLDAIASWQLEKIIRCDQYLADLQFWKLKVSDDNSAVLTCERDTDDIACEQKIPFTDFPIQEICLYLVNMGNGEGVLMLPSEY